MNTLLDFPYQRVLVLGLAKSGTAAANLLLTNDIFVRINDLNGPEDDVTLKHFEQLGADLVIGSHPLTVLDDIELVVKNPGINYRHPIIQEAENRNIPIITEIELAGRLTAGPIIGVTGSNGKTTTSTLITHMLEKSNQPVKVAGNIGIVATEIAQTMRENETMVIELSSFQLLGVQTFKPKIAVLLNIFDAHLDYHETVENYQKAKFNIFANQTKDDFLVYNADDPVLSDAVQHATATLIPFSLKKQLPEGAWVDGDSIYFQNERIMKQKDITLVGDHNLANILAALSAAKISGATNKGIQQVLSSFTGVKHRLQFVTKLKDRYFYNDSKATNILATQKALLSFQQPTILLAGGLDRGNEFDELIPFLSHVKAMVVFGETADKLVNIAQNSHINIVKKVKNVEEATRQAYELSVPNDVILLSPACASWDQYRTFEERGDMFIHAVHKLE